MADRLDGGLPMLQCGVRMMLIRDIKVHLHLAPEPHALARAGCWITFSTYVYVLPSCVVRVNLALFSFSTGLRPGPSIG